ncbi:hypothetical protein [Cohaesibacter celericrescens]|uniref:hypothetical protein n=1 Tax=Cohaesibacter celericrescens TaxID=2067669 RepID=UPI001FE14776|nr:hypothetical protein [Cohaesibacter celericrescens]
MLSHDTIWNAIDRLASQKNLSPSGLARLAGLDSTSFNPSKRVKLNGRPRWPSTESIAKILSVTDTSASVFFDYTSDVVAKTPNGEADVCLCRDILTHKPVALCSINQRGKKTESEANLIFTLRVKGTHFMPFYQNGSHLLLSFDGNHKIGHRVIVKTNDRDFLLGDVEHSSPDLLQLWTLSQERAMQTIALSSIEWVARILWASQ